MNKMAAPLLVLALVAPAVSTAPPKDDYPVTMAVVAAKPDAEGWQRLEVRLTIQKDYDLFAHAEDADLPSGPIVKVTGKGLSGGVKVTYPKGELVEDKVIGSYRIYTGKVSITAVVKRTPGNRQPLLVTARLRPFDASGCRWPMRTLKQEIP